MRAVLDRLLDRVEESTVTGDSIIRALRAYTCLADDRHWVEPPSRVLYSSERRYQGPQAASLKAAGRPRTKPNARRKPQASRRTSPARRSNRHSGD
jgi:hypothetical protein